MKEKTKPFLLKEDLDELAGKVFTDGPYEYRIYVRTGSLGDDDIVSISIFVENTPDYVGGDLYMYALKHVAAVAGQDHIQTSDWMINKAILESHESLGEMTALILRDSRNILGLQSYPELYKKIQANLDKKIVFDDVKNMLQIRERKLTKVLEYMKSNVTKVEGVPVRLTYTISGEIKRHNDSILAPRLNATISVDFKSNNNLERDQIKDVTEKVHEMMEDLSPIDIHSYDNIRVTSARQ